MKKLTLYAILIAFIFTGCVDYSFSSTKQLLTEKSDLYTTTLMNGKYNIESKDVDVYIKLDGNSNKYSVTFEEHESKRYVINLASNYYLTQYYDKEYNKYRYTLIKGDLKKKVIEVLTLDLLFKTKLSVYFKTEGEDTYVLQPSNLDKVKEIIIESIIDKNYTFDSELKSN